MLTYLIVIPLVSGYFFANKWNGSKYSIKRSEGYRLYFDSALYGLVLLFFAVLLDFLLIQFFPLIKDIGYIVIQQVLPLVCPPKVLPYISISFFTLILGFFSPLIINRLSGLFKRDDNFYLLKAVKDDDFEDLLVRSCERGLPVCLTLENSKIYVGVLWRGINPSLQRKEVSIIPLVSGYRSEPDKKMVITTYYQGIYDLIEDLDSDKLGDLCLEDFVKVIPVNQIVSSNLFDFKAYGEFITQRS